MLKRCCSCLFGATPTRSSKHVDISPNANRCATNGPGSPMPWSPSKGWGSGTKSWRLEGWSMTKYVPWTPLWRSLGEPLDALASSTLEVPDEELPGPVHEAEAADRPDSSVHASHAHHKAHDDHRCATSQAAQAHSAVGCPMTSCLGSIMIERQSALNTA